MNKKIGKFKVWQLVALGAAIGLAVYLLKRKESGGINPEEVVGGTGTGAFGPIDPNTGIPYAFESGLGGSGSGGGEGSGAGEAGAPGEPGLIESITETINEAAPGGEGAASPTTKAAKKTAKHKAKEQKKHHKAEHKSTHKPKSTGAAAHAPHKHHAPAPPVSRLGSARTIPTKPPRAFRPGPRRTQPKGRYVKPHRKRRR